MRQGDPSTAAWYERFCVERRRSKFIRKTEKTDPEKRIINIIRRRNQTQAGKFPLYTARVIQNSTRIPFSPNISFLLRFRTVGKQIKKKTQCEFVQQRGRKMHSPKARTPKTARGTPGLMRDASQPTVTEARWGPLLLVSGDASPTACVENGNRPKDHNGLDPKSMSEGSNEEKGHTQQLQVRPTMTLADESTKKITTRESEQCEAATL